MNANSVAKGRPTAPADGAAADRSKSKKAPKLSALARRIVSRHVVEFLGLNYGGATELDIARRALGIDVLDPVTTAQRRQVQEALAELIAAGLVRQAHTCNRQRSYVLVPKTIDPDEKAVLDILLPLVPARGSLVVWCSGWMPDPTDEQMEAGEPYTVWSEVQLFPRGTWQLYVELSDRTTKDLRLTWSEVLMESDHTPRSLCVDALDRLRDALEDVPAYAKDPDAEEAIEEARARLDKLLPR